jgi:peptide/nickel transport system permease protein
MSTAELPLEQAQQAAQAHKADSPTRRAIRRFQRHRLAMIALVVFSVICLSAIFAPLIERYPPDAISLRDKFDPPSAEHWFGTDRLGRDVWSRTIHGGRVSLAVGLTAALISTLIGLIFGSVSGYYSGWPDMFVMRLTDVFLTFPPIIIMLAIAAFVGQSIVNVILIIGLLSWPTTARLVRGQVLSVREEQFVLASRSLGAKNSRLINLHVLPNTIAPLLAEVTFAVGAAILTEAGLSFLGLGVPQPIPSWGNMLESARSLDILENGPWMWVPPAIMTLLTILCINFIGDGVRDAIDPRHRGKA